MNYVAIAYWIAGAAVLVILTLDRLPTLKNLWPHRANVAIGARTPIWSESPHRVFSLN